MMELIRSPHFWVGFLAALLLMAILLFIYAVNYRYKHEARLSTVAENNYNLGLKHSAALFNTPMFELVSALQISNPNKQWFSFDGIIPNGNVRLHAQTLGELSTKIYEAQQTYAITDPKLFVPYLRSDEWISLPEKTQ